MSTRTSTRNSLLTDVMSTPLRTSRRQTTSRNDDDLTTTTSEPVRRSPRLSERDIGLKATSSRIPTPPRAGKRMLIAISETVTSTPRQTEFSDDEDYPHTEESTGLKMTFRDYADLLKVKTTQTLSSVTRHTSDLYFRGRHNVWDSRSENVRRSIVAIILILCLFPFVLPHYQHYASVISQHSRTFFLSVPDLLGGVSSSDFVAVPSNSFPFDFAKESSVGSRQQHQDLDIQTIVDKMISDPKFINMIKSEHAKRSQELQQTSDNEKKIADLIKKFQSEMESRNSRLTSEIKTLKVEVEGKLEEVVGKIPSFGSQLDSLSSDSMKIGREMDSKLDQLDLELSTTRRDIESLKLAKTQAASEMTEVTSAKISELEEKLSNLNEEYKTLMKIIQGCQSKYSTIEEQVEALVHEILGQTNGNRDIAVEALINNVTSRFVTDVSMSERMKNWSENLRKEFEAEVQVMIAEKVKSNLHEKVEVFEDAIYQRVSEDLTKSQPTFSKDEIARIVQDALMTYDADKTGLFDFALESAGGTIASTRCTETYDISNAVYSVWGFPIWWNRNNPRTILQPGSSPGQCWAFRGSQGSVAINLSSPIIVKAVTLEHIPATLAPDGTITSAPKKFEVFGLKSLTDENPENLGNFTYDEHGSPVQTFYLAQPSKVPYNLIELKVLSNYGNMVYTCIYRFRIHGSLN